MSKEDKKIEDAYIMGEQDLVYKVVKVFLESDEAQKMNITGLYAYKDKEYINLEWKFGKENN